MVARDTPTPDAVPRFDCAAAAGAWHAHTSVTAVPGENEVEQLACIMEVLGPPPAHLVTDCSRRKHFFDEHGEPRILPNSKGKKRRPVRLRAATPPRRLGVSQGAEEAWGGGGGGGRGEGELQLRDPPGVARLGGRHECLRGWMLCVWRTPRASQGSKDLISSLQCTDVAFVSFLEGCLQWDAAQRLSAEGALKHEWVLDWAPPPFPPPQQPHQSHTGYSGPLSARGGTPRSGGAAPAGYGMHGRSDRPATGGRRGPQSARSAGCSPRASGGPVTTRQHSAHTAQPRVAHSGHFTARLAVGSTPAAHYTQHYTQHLRPHTPPDQHGNGAAWAHTGASSAREAAALAGAMCTSATVPPTFQLPSIDGFDAKSSLRAAPGR